MSAAMLSHVNHLTGFLGSAKRGLDHRLWRAHEGDHGAVGGFAWVYVKQFDAFYGFYLVSDELDYPHVTSFAEVGYTLNDWLFVSHKTYYVFVCVFFTDANLPLLTLFSK
jgi:hypothetical protein